MQTKFSQSFKQVIVSLKLENIANKIKGAVGQTTQHNFLNPLCRHIRENNV